MKLDFGSILISRGILFQIIELAILGFLYVLVRFGTVYVKLRLLLRRLWLLGWRLNFSCIASGNILAL